jgi:hypothetical protein
MNNPNNPELLAVKDNGSPEAIYKYKGDILTAEIVEDAEGQLYYFVEDKAHYLPDNMQPKD